MSMDYELKKQLIDAGYRGVNGRMDFTLEELIETCKTKYLYLHLVETPDGWCAALIEFEGSMRFNILNSETPLIAVANLYLALKK